MNRAFCCLFLRVLVAAAIVSLMAACGGPAATLPAPSSPGGGPGAPPKAAGVQPEAAAKKPPLRIRIAYGGAPETKDQPSLLALKALPADQYQVEIIAAGGVTNARAAVVSSEAEVANSSVAIMSAIAKGARIKAFAESYGITWRLVSAKSITSPAQLDGRPVGVSGGSGQPEIMFKLAVTDKFGIKPQLVTAAQSKDRIQALLAGKLDATNGTHEDFMFADQTRPGAYHSLIVYGQEFRGLGGSYLWVTDDLIKNHPEAVQDMADSMLITFRKFLDNPELLLQEWQKAYKEEPESKLRSILKLSMEGNLLTANGGMDRETLQYTHDFHYKNGAIADPLPLEQWAAPQFMERSLAKFGKR